MVKKILVKQNDGVKQDSGGTAVSCEVVNVPYTDEASYGIHFAGPSKHLEDVAEVTEVDNGGFEFVQDFQTYASGENIICVPDVILTEKEVEVAAYATLAADGRSGAVPAVVLEANMCPMGCGTGIKSENHLRGHLKESHAIPIQKEMKQFPNMGSFLSWKEARERESSRRYVVRETRHDWRRFACSRSGQPTGTDRPQRWKRTGNFCPAFIRTTTFQNGSVKARYSLFHTCKQPDNSALPSDRELAKANQQLGLLEQAISKSQPKKRRRRKRTWGDDDEPQDRRSEPQDRRSEPQDRRSEAEAGTEPEPEPEPEPESESEPGSAHMVDEDGLFSVAPQVTMSPASQPRRAARAGIVRHRLAFSATPDKRKISAPSEPVKQPSSASAEGEELTVKQRVRTNLLRLHAKLEQASATEAEQMLTDTELLLERHTTLRRRGRTGTVFRRRGRLAAELGPGHQYAIRTGPAAAGPPDRPAAGGQKGDGQSLLGTDGGLRETQGDERQRQMEEEGLGEEEEEEGEGTWQDTLAAMEATAAGDR